MTNKPKKEFRLKEIVVVGLIFLLLVALSGGFDNYGTWHLSKALNPSGWIFKQLNNIAEICIGLFAMYTGHRIINHMRTHELLKTDCHHDKIIITSVWIMAIAYVVGNAIR